MSKIKWRESLKWSEDQVEDLRFIGYAYLRQGKYEIALPIFNALSALDPENPYDTQTLGALYLQLGQAEKAIKYFNKALTLDTDHAPTLLNMAKSFFLLGKKEEGLRIVNLLKNDSDLSVANTANALALAYG